MYGQIFAPANESSAGQLNGSSGGLPDQKKMTMITPLVKLSASIVNQDRLAGNTDLRHRQVFDPVRDTFIITLPGT
jgi:hypothetical protein